MTEVANTLVGTVDLSYGIGQAHKRPRQQVHGVKRSFDATEDALGPSPAAAPAQHSDTSPDQIHPITDEILWTHPTPEQTHLWVFLQRVNEKYNRHFQTYTELHQWGQDNVAALWAEIWEYCNIRHAAPYVRVVSDADRMWPRPTWFEGSTLNFAQNLLFPPSAQHEDMVAVVSVTEVSREHVSWADLRERVRQCQAAMKTRVRAGDRVAGYVANSTAALVAMLAATSLGAIWTAVSPDIGVAAALDRIAQTEPTLLFAEASVLYNAKTYPLLPKVNEIAASLHTLKSLVVFQEPPPGFLYPELAGAQVDVMSYDEFVASADPCSKLEFPQFPAEHPVYILYSSGTTGAPKCIVHGAIGALLQHKKEHMLQNDIRSGDRLFYFTTCNWMMWHWLVSGLASGATIILYDGSPFFSRSQTGQSVKDNFAMPKLIDELSITHFGTSAKFLSVLQQENVLPKTLPSLKAIYSTGSPLAPATFRYVYRAFGQVHLASITGGTDIITDFGTACPLRSVHTGEVQALGLGMAVQAWDTDGKNVGPYEEPGELVCVKPFPSQPVCFWGDSEQLKYRSAYFEQYPGVWAHGDYIRMNPATGGMTMLGRSDGVLNPSGVRFGSAEMYNLLLKHFTDIVEDAICVGRRLPEDTDETVVLFLKIKKGKTFTPELAQRIKGKARSDLSQRHVIHVVDECPEIPVTANGKKVERAVKQILSGGGMHVKISASVANGHCLEWYRTWAKSH